MIQPLDNAMPNDENLVVEAAIPNIFADLGQPDAAEMSLKSGLGAQIVRAVRARGLTQRQTAELVGLKPPDVSNIMRARLDGFSVERLFAVLNRLGHRIEVRVATAEPENARTLLVG